MPLIINTDIATYHYCFLTYEDDKYIVIAVIDKTGAEFAKIINKNTVLSVEVLYQQMLKTPEDNKEGDMYVWLLLFKFI